MTFFQLRTEKFVPAPPERVWAELTDFASFPEWNPLVLEAKGPAEPGGRVAIRVPNLAQPSKILAITARITRFEPGRELAWIGVVPLVFSGEHYWSLRPAPGGTMLEHGERFGGLLPRIWGKAKLESFRPYYERLNTALVERVSSGARVTA